MNANRYRHLVDSDGTEHKFSSSKLKYLIREKVMYDRTNGIRSTAEQLREQIAQAAFVTPAAVKNWTYGQNGPSDMETVQSIAKVLGVDYHKLLQDKENEQMTNVADYMVDKSVDLSTEKSIIRMIYLKMWKLLHDFEFFYLYFEGGQEECEAELRKLELDYADILNSLQQHILDFSNSTYTNIERFITEKLATYALLNEEQLSDMFMYDGTEDGFLHKDGTPIAPIESPYIQYVRHGFYDDIRALFINYIPADHLER